MPEYIYEATNEDGIPENGEFSAVSKKKVIAHLKRKHLIPIVIREKKKVRIGKFASFGVRFTMVDQIALVRNLSATTKAGIGMLEAMDILIADASKKVVERVLITAKSNLENGQPLSATFELYPKYFSPVFVGMIKTGEVSGQLGRVLEELAVQMQKEYGLFRRVRSAFIYPAILLSASAVIIFLLLTAVLPRLADTFASSEVTLPAVTSFLINVGELLNKSFLLDFLVLAGLIWFFLFSRKTKWARRLIDFFLFHMPIIRDLSKRISLVRFSRTFGNLIASGISVLEAMDLSAEAVGNIYYKDAILTAKKEVQSGARFSQALGRYPELFPRIFISMIGVGEKTGTLEKIFKDFADFYEEEVDSTLKNLTTFLEPILLLFMGLVIAAIALSILLPIYQLVGSFV